MATPTVVLTEVRGHFEVALAHAFLGYVGPLVGQGKRLTILHDWSASDSYDTETRKLLTRFTEMNRQSLERIVIYTKSRLVRMGIATAKLVVGGIVDAVGTRAQLDALVAEVTNTPRRMKG